jgi:hypothetical protein
VQAKDEGFLKTLSDAGRAFGDFQTSLLLPASDLFCYSDFMFAGAAYRPGDATVSNTNNQVRRPPGAHANCCAL